MKPITRSRKLALALVLGATAATSFSLSSRGFKTARADEPRVIKISAKKFEFIPNEITLNKGETVTLELNSEDRTHGFLVKPLGIDTDIPAGKSTTLTVTPTAAGTYPVICDHYCGVGHGNMKMTIVVK